MKSYYFVGGPKSGQSEEFFRRLRVLGGIPPAWRIYPHVANDGRALHVVRVESPNEILEHLRHFDGIYERGEIIEIVER